MRDVKQGSSHLKGASSPGQHITQNAITPGQEKFSNARVATGESSCFERLILLLG